MAKIRDEKFKRISDDLYKEVKKQSTKCDVTVQVGNWSRRYHWCVLVLCPFFAAVYRHDTKERANDRITLGIGSAFAVDTLIQTLYGRKLTISEKTVEEILEAADFLGMVKIRQTCIDYIREEIHISAKNCFTIQHMCLKYDFKHPSLKLFLETHILEVLDTKAVQYMTEQFVIKVLKNPRNECISKELFYLTVKWANIFPRDERRSAFANVFSHLQLEMLDADYIENVIKQEKLVRNNGRCLDKISKLKSGKTFILAVDKSKTRLVAYGIDDGVERFICGLPGTINESLKLIAASDSQACLLTDPYTILCINLENHTTVIKKSTTPVSNLVTCGGRLFVVNKSPLREDGTCCTQVYAESESMTTFDELLTIAGPVVSMCATSNGILCFLTKGSALHMFDPEICCHRKIELSGTLNAQRIVPKGPDQICAL